MESNITKILRLLAATSTAVASATMASITDINKFEAKVQRITNDISRSFPQDSVEIYGDSFRLEIEACCREWCEKWCGHSTHSDIYLNEDDIYPTENDTFTRDDILNDVIWRLLREFTFTEIWEEEQNDFKRKLGLSEDITEEDLKRELKAVLKEYKEYYGATLEVIAGDYRYNIDNADLDVLFKIKVTIDMEFIDLLIRKAHGGLSGQELDELNRQLNNIASRNRWNLNSTPNGDNLSDCIQDGTWTNLKDENVFSKINSVLYDYLREWVYIPEGIRETCWYSLACMLIDHPEKLDQKIKDCLKIALPMLTKIVGRVEHRYEGDREAGEAIEDLRWEEISGEEETNSEEYKEETTD